MWSFLPYGRAVCDKHLLTAGLVALSDCPLTATECDPRVRQAGLGLTVIQRPLQDGRVAGAAVPDAREGQHLDLVEHVFAQACELDAEGRVPFHQPDPGLGVRVLLLIHHLSEPSAG